ncbi:MAG: hypothetical protein QOJ51_1488 [Acidobacteriaceae bacterium]|jgi:hypothetical protein|nr:hypothetical protein [Acidobacteriaceae bacterium]MEA2258663.1 hypothetical protein [Acidobacteriaceae bacterium]
MLSAPWKGRLPSLSRVAVLPMPSNPQPEILPPQKSRFRKANGLFADENLDVLSHLLDDWFRVPGTSIRFGLDGIIGLVPGLGDIIGGLASTIIVVAAWVRGVPYVTLLRMVVNIGIEVLLGTIPLLGDAFDIAWKANRRNYALVVRHLQQSRRQTWRDWVFLILIGLVLAATFLAPIFLILWFLEWLGHHV